MSEIAAALRWVGRASCIACAGAMLLFNPMPSHADTLCPVSPRDVAAHLPHLRAAVAHGAEGLIVALGSSSTEGAMASDPGHSYPAVLQATLSRVLPHAHVAVLNRGIGGQDAPEELARLDTDVIAAHPQLVIWQVGANGALRNADPDEFRRTVTNGVKRLQAAGIDVILMDNQIAPRIEASPEHAALNAELAEVAADTGAGLFSRTALMESWEREGARPPDFIASDGLHHNDRGYACVARAMADGIVASLQGSGSLTASR